MSKENKLANTKFFVRMSQGNGKREKWYDVFAKDETQAYFRARNQYAADTGYYGFPYFYIEK